MKHKFRAAILSVLIILAFSFLIYAVSSENLPSEAAEPVIAKSPEYMLRLENDEIVIYKDGKSTDTGIAVPDLRQQDRALLESGISVDSYEDVLKLIEDFNS
ncbi:MAG: hypothetical protein IJ017_03735 [Oscillospiraceae bacterium]|nr:hypothetical protein [Oscillospiraceae bacterium]